MIVLLTLAFAAHAQSVVTSGVCPGTVEIAVSEVTPGGGYAILRGGGPGAAAIPGGPCAGVRTALDRIDGVYRFTADGDGSGRLAPVIGTPDAGRIQVLDLGRCTLSATTDVCAPEAAYVGAYVVRDGPHWSEDPPTYSCVEGCALVFGGSADGYQCSSTDARIDNLGFLDGWGDETYCARPTAEDFKAGDTYDCGASGCSYSAWVDDHDCASTNHCFTVGELRDVRCDDATEVAWEGRCYYLDGSGGACAVGYELAPQSALAVIADGFAGKTYRSDVSGNCCVAHRDQADEGQEWGMAIGCNAPGPFAEGPVRGGAGCFGVLVSDPDQLTLCRSI